MTGAAAAFVSGSGGIAIAFSPGSVSGYYAAGGTANISTGSVLATASGGVAPYTYAWARTDSSAYTWVIGAPTAATTSFGGQSIPEGVQTFADFELTVTDASSNTAKKTITATVRNNITFDPGDLR
jgi:hypothetical protein